MEGGIKGIPSIHGPRDIGHNRRENRRRSRDFEDTLHGGEPPQPPEEGAENPDPIGDSGLEPRSKPLQKGRLRGRRDDEGRRHVDVLA